MKVVLLENVEHLGIAGDVKDVADGYARNFLLPKKLASKIGDKKGKIMLKKISEKREKMKKDMEEMRVKAKSLEGKKVKFQAKANPLGKLYAAIMSADVAKKLEVDSDRIQMKPIKEAGEYKATVRLWHNIKAEVIVIVETNK